MRSHAARGLVAVTTASALVLLSACAGGGSTGDEGDSGELLPLEERPSVAIAVPFLTNMDVSKGEPDFRVFPAYEPLIYHDRDNTQQPGLAEEWGYVGEGNTTFRLKLREGVKFSDGEPLTADAVKTWFEYMDKGTSVGAQKLPDIASYSVVDDLTLEFTLTEPSPIVPFLLSDKGLSWGYVASPKAVTETPELLATETFGAGAYMIDPARTVPDAEFEMVPNEYYYDEDAMRFSSISMDVISDSTTSISAMQSGQIDLAQGDLASIETARSAGQVVAPRLDVGVFSPGVNLRDWGGTLIPALGDVRVRQALNYAVDREAVAKAIGVGADAVTDQLVTPDGFDEEYLGRYEYDPDKARELLEEAGYADGFSFEAVFFDANQTHGIDSSTLSQAIAGYFEDIGVEMKIKPVSTAGDFVKSLTDPSVAIMQSVVPPEPIWNAYFSAFRPGSFHNPIATADPVLEDLIERGAVAPEDEASEIWKEMSRHVVDQAYLLPVLRSQRYMYLSPDLAELIGVGEGEPFSLWNQFATSNKSY